MDPVVLMTMTEETDAHDPKAEMQEEEQVWVKNGVQHWLLGGLSKSAGGAGQGQESLMLKLKPAGMKTRDKSRREMDAQKWMDLMGRHGC